MTERKEANVDLLGVDKSNFVPRSFIAETPIAGRGELRQVRTLSRTTEKILGSDTALPAADDELRLYQLAHLSQQQADTRYLRWEACMAHARLLEASRARGDPDRHQRDASPGPDFAPEVCGGRSHP